MEDFRSFLNSWKDECVLEEIYSCRGENFELNSWRLPLNKADEPLYVPESYGVELNFTGLRENDKGL